MDNPPAFPLSIARPRAAINPDNLPAFLEGKTRTKLDGNPDKLSVETWTKPDENPDRLPPKEQKRRGETGGEREDGPPPLARTVMGTTATVDSRSNRIPTPPSWPWPWPSVGGP
jgi:hypothetical protein